jgi:hypothetical protein
LLRVVVEELAALRIAGIIRVAKQESDPSEQSA